MMESYDERVRRAAEAIERADALLIGGGAGLSTAAGVDYAGMGYRREFADFIERYGVDDLYSLGFYPFKTPEEYWAQWARHILFARFDPPALPLYRRLYDLVRDRPYFVLTTNVDGQFQKAGFADEHIFATQGDYSMLQCAKGCHDTLYPDEDLMRRMDASTQECRIASDLVPICPVCGGPMAPNLRADAYFVQDSHWYEADERYGAFVNRYGGGNLVMLELGVGFNTPGIIRFPFERRTYANERATLVRMNKDYPEGPAETASRTVAFVEDMQACVADICAHGRKEQRA
jgi:NAD-dependent SIR2 family protein deacetylase